MKERLLESFAILLAGLFAAERPRPRRLGDATAAANQAALDQEAAASSKQPAES